MTATCPRCRADRGEERGVPVPRGTCDGCGTDWERGPLGQMVARGRA